MTALDHAFEKTRSGDPAGFADWVRLVELPLRRGLARFAHAVDVEAVVQDALLRMWRLAPTLALEGPDASLRFAHVVAKNLAREELRRARRFEPLPDDGAHDIAIEPEPPADPALRRIIVRCFGKLGGRPKRALALRLAGGAPRPDRELAAELGMTVNTFLQNVVRAREALRKCFAKHGLAQGEVNP